MLTRLLRFALCCVLGSSAFVFVQYVFAQDPATINEYVYATPAGWNATQYPDGLVLMSPLSATNERCIMTLWPMRASGPNLQVDADSIFQQVYQAYQRRDMTMRGTPMPPTMTRGTSGQGWDYVIVRKGIGPPGSAETRLGFVFVAKLNNRLAVISGLSKDPLVSTCFGELAYNAWPRFFYSLRFKNWTAVDQAAALRKKLVGTWTVATGSVADQFTFAANGRYAGAAAVQNYSPLSGTEVLQTTRGFFGNGSYSLKENTITLTADNRKNQPETGLFRLEEESKDGGASWEESFYLLRVSAVDGKDYEVRYQKK